MQRSAGNISDHTRRRGGRGAAFVAGGALLLACSVWAQDQEPAGEPQEPDAVQQAVADDGLANAQRLSQELDQMLTPEGWLSPEAGEMGPTRLASFATRCGILLNNSDFSDAARSVVLNSQARAYAALFHAEAPDPEDPSGPRRLTQLRGVADQISALDLPIAAPAADYWLMLAELADLSQTNMSPRARREMAEQQLSAYIGHYARSQSGADFVIDARLSLARLLDERGDQAGAFQQLVLIGELAEDDPRVQEVQRLSDRIERLGRPIAFEGITIGARVWNSAQAQEVNQPLLIHVYADSVEPSVRMVQGLTRAIAQGQLDGCMLVSLRLGERVPGTDLPVWPTLPTDIEPGGVLEQLGVDALPTLAWVDHEGRLASIGYSLDVLDHRPVLEVEEDEPQPQPQPEPGAEDQASGPDEPEDQAQESE